MPKGRPPKPDNVHQLHGTRSKVTRTEGHESPEPIPVMETPKAPYSLTQDVAILKWKETADRLIACKVLKDTDLDALESYCISYQMMISASEEIEQTGMTVTGGMGGLVANPACAVLARSQAELRQLSTLLGLNPSARTRINVGDKEKEKPKGLGSLSRPRRG